MLAALPDRGDAWHPEPTTPYRAPGPQKRVPLQLEPSLRSALLGVVADALQRGIALIAVDGQPPRPFRVGARVAEGYVLQAVGARSATVGAQANAASAFTLQLPTTPMAIPAPPSQR